MRRLLLAAALASLALPAGARATSVGIVDHVYYSYGVVTGTETSSAAFRNLHRRLARIAVPYDVAQRPDTDPVKQHFETWLAGVNATGAEPYVTFVADNPRSGRFKDTYVPADRSGWGHCVNAKHGVRCRVPSAGAYTTAVAAFVARYLPLGVRTIGAWNEPDFGPSTGRTYRTPKGDARMYAARCARATLDTCGPMLAARYYAIVRFLFYAHHCPTPICLSVAGEFSGATPARSGPRKGYFQAYAFFLGALHLHPYVWAIHPYGDLRHRTIQVTHRVLTGSRFLGVHSPLFTTNELMVGRGGHRHYPHSKLWASATGTAYGSGQAAKIQAYITAASRLNAKGSPRSTAGRLSRVYIYNWNHCPTCHGIDSGIVSPTGKLRPAYAVLQRAPA